NLGRDYAAPGQYEPTAVQEGPHVKGKALRQRAMRVEQQADDPAEDLEGVRVVPLRRDLAVSYRHARRSSSSEPLRLRWRAVRGSSVDQVGGCQAVRRGSGCTPARARSASARDIGWSSSKAASPVRTNSRTISDHDNPRVVASSAMRWSMSCGMRTVRTTITSDSADWSAVDGGT